VRRRFFVETFLNGRAELRGEAAHHLGRVLRAETGQLYELSDGETAWLGRVEAVSPDAVSFALVEPINVSESKLRVDLLLAIVKFDRFEWALEKATELGVSAVTPLAAARSDKALVQASAKRAGRWKKILLEASQQSRRLRVPELRRMAKTEAAFRAAPAGLRLLLSERSAAQPMQRALQSASSQLATICIGPEGGWTEGEIAAAREAGFLEVSLGGNILRTETAVIAALAALNFALGD
jgi:16S rRNA (uracil1498-N3)-methyltransferase